MSTASGTGVAATIAAAALALFAVACGGGDNDAAEGTTESAERDRGTELLGLAAQPSPQAT